MYCTRDFVIKLVRPIGDAKSLNGSSVNIHPLLVLFQIPMFCHPTGGSEERQDPENSFGCEEGRPFSERTSLEDLSFFSSEVPRNSRCKLLTGLMSIFRRQRHPTYPTKSHLFFQIELNLVFTHSLEPFPAKITQNQPQLVRYTGNAHGYLAYEARSIKTVVTVSSKNIESYTKVKPVLQSDSTITYGPYENLQPFGTVRAVLCINHRCYYGRF